MTDYARYTIALAYFDIEVGAFIEQLNVTKDSIVECVDKNTHDRVILNHCESQIDGLLVALNMMIDKFMSTAPLDLALGRLEPMEYSNLRQRNQHTWRGLLNVKDEIRFKIKAIVEKDFTIEE